MQSSTVTTEPVQKEVKIKMESEPIADEQNETKETVEKLEIERVKDMMEEEKPNPPGMFFL